MDAKKLARFQRKLPLKVFVRYGNIAWCRNLNKLVRERYGGLPAVIWRGGDKWWYKNGKTHREDDLPAIVSSDGTREWHRDGKWYRELGKPYLIWADGSLMNLEKNNTETTTSVPVCSYQ